MEKERNPKFKPKPHTNPAQEPNNRAQPNSFSLSRAWADQPDPAAQPRHSRAAQPSAQPVPAAHARASASRPALKPSLLAPSACQPGPQASPSAQRALPAQPRRALRR